MTTQDLTFDFHNKTVFITGGTSTIGSAIAQKFARAHADVIFTYHTNSSKAQLLADELLLEAPSVHCLPLDQAQPDACRAVFQQAADSWGPIDICINNSGLHGHCPSDKISPQEWDTLINTNLRGVFFCMQAAVHYMVRQNTGGSIINISSIHARNLLENALHYGAAKAGIEQLTRGFAAEFGKHDIRVNAIAPGLIETPSLDDYCPGWRERYTQRAPLARAGRPEDIANLCLFLASPLSSWITGQTIIADGGITLAPYY